MPVLAHRRVLPAAIAAGLLALAALSLLASATVRYDAFAWLVWGRQLVTDPAGLTTFGGPAWKPLPVLIDAVLAPLGSAAPSGWLVIARASGGAAVVLAGALAHRRGGWPAAIVAGASLALAQGWWFGLARGINEPLLIACLLGAALLADDGRHRAAHFALLAAALCRTEAWPLLAAHALWAVWRGRMPLWLPALSALALLVLWFVPDWYSTGDPFHQSVAARMSAESLATPHSLGGATRTVTSRALGVLPAVVWVLAGVGAVVAWRRRDPLVGLVALAVLAWDGVVLVQTFQGYAGLSRFTLPAAAGACVVAGTGAAWALAAARERLGAGRGLAVAAALLAVLLVPSWVVAGRSSAAELAGTNGRTSLDALSAAVAHVGGPAGVRRLGALRVNEPLTTAAAWIARSGFAPPRNSRPQRWLTVRIRPSAYAGPAAPVPRGRRCWTARGPGWEAVLTTTGSRRCPAQPRRSQRRQAAGALG